MRHGGCILNKELIRAAIKKGEIDEGMEQIIELLVGYNIKDEEWLDDAIYHLLYDSFGSALVREEE